MKQLPFPLRVAAGLAVITAERARELPGQLTGLPVTVISRVLQSSMRLQQQVTELAIKGDDVLATFRPVEETPSWATFDEDINDSPQDPAGDPREAYGTVSPFDRDTWPEPSLPDRPEPPAQRNGHPRDTDGAHPRKPEVPTQPSARARAAAPTDPWTEEGNALARRQDAPDTPAPDTADTTEAAPDLAPAAPSDAHAAPEGDGPGGIHNYDELTLPQLRAKLRTLSLAQLEELIAYERGHANRASFVGMLSRRIANVGKSDEDSGDEGSPER